MTKVQEAYDALQSIKTERAKLALFRKEQLMEDSEYAELTENIGRTREARDQIAAAWDGKHPGTIERLDKFSEETKKREAVLAALILKDMQQNKPVEVYKTTKSGKRKKVIFEFRVAVRQQSMF